MVIDYDRLIVLDKGQVGVVHLVFGGHNSRLLSCTVDRLRNLIRPGISSIRLMVYSGICVFEAGPSMSWRPQRRQRQGQTIHDRRPDVYYFYIYLFLSHNIGCLLVSHSAFAIRYYKNTALPRKCKIAVTCSLPMVHKMNVIERVSRLPLYSKLLYEIPVRNA